MQPSKYVNPTVLATDFSVSVQSCQGVHTLQIHRHPRRMSNDNVCPMLYGDLHGLQFDNAEEAFAAAFDHGYEERFGRNTVQFHRSRASRKRGFPDMNVDPSWKTHIMLGERRGGKMRETNS